MIADSSLHIDSIDVDRPSSRQWLGKNLNIPDACCVVPGEHLHFLKPMSINSDHGRPYSVSLPGVPIFDSNSSSVRNILQNLYKGVEVWRFLVVDAINHDIVVTCWVQRTSLTDIDPTARKDVSLGDLIREVVETGCSDSDEATGRDFIQVLDDNILLDIFSIALHKQANSFADILIKDGVEMKELGDEFPIDFDENISFHQFAVRWSFGQDVKSDDHVVLPRERLAEHTLPLRAKSKSPALIKRFEFEHSLYLTSLHLFTILYLLQCAQRTIEREKVIS
ncbi:hypothetical protein HG530_015049 [Fusarium avenaceum]|nr:hypothetical protein HG530_015049 [Fusarium avenaceum]